MFDMDSAAMVQHARQFTEAAFQAGIAAMLPEELRPRDIRIFTPAAE